ncbi:MAG: hypothetical protein RMA76_39000 [Deltaproteobacteria bacterium]|jgi:hypothetical protein
MNDDRIQEGTTAWRPRVGGRIDILPAWHDLDEEGRREAFEETVALRKLEAALDPDGLSSTAHAVLDRIRRA